MAILIPLFKVFEYRYYLAKFLFNLQLYRYIQKSYSIETALLTIYSIYKSLTLFLASRVIIRSLTIPLITSRAAMSYTTSLRLLSPIYRAISPSSPIYQNTSKAYLIVQDLYIRYVPLKFIYLALKLALKIASYLIVQNLYNRFKFSKKSYYNIVNRTVIFGSKLFLRSILLVSKASPKSIEKNIGKVVYSIKIGPSDIKLVFDLKISLMKPFQASHSNIKTPFSLRQKWNTQVFTIQSLCYIRSPKYISIVNTSKSIFRSYNTSLFSQLATDVPYKDLSSLVNQPKRRSIDTQQISIQFD